MKPDRRRTPRTKPEGLAYISFEPDGSGIVLDISEGGLCFQSVAPVQPDEVIHLWFSAEGDRIAIEGRLAWIDEKRKIGGLQFNVLSAEAHRQIHNWIGAIDDAVRGYERKPTAPVPPQVSASDAFAGSSASTIGAVGQSVFSQWLRARIRWAQFSRSLAAGLHIGLLVTVAFLFHTHKETGNLLIAICGLVFLACSYLLYHTK